MNHLDLVKLTALMKRTSGKSEIMVGLLDGPVATNHPDLEREHIREIPGSRRGACTQTKRVVLQKLSEERNERDSPPSCSA
jgi:hypothetical protein